MGTPEAEATGAHKPVDLVFEGGGVKGIGLAGAYKALWDADYRPECVAGTSAGAITAAMVAVGYTGDELQSIVLNKSTMDFQKFEDRATLDTFGMPGDVFQFLIARGMHSGDYFLGWMRERLAEKRITKFGQLRADSPSTEERQYRLQVIASDLSTHRMLVLPRDARIIGKDPDELEIAEAVRMSMSIPVFFKPVIARDSNRRQHTIVDGGLLSNYPIWLFDCPPAQRPGYPTFGLLLVAPRQRDPLLPELPQGAPLPSVRSPVQLAIGVVETMMQAHDRIYVEQANFARTIPIDTLGVTTTQFDISEDLAGKLFESGGTAASDFLKTWDHAEYIERFRTGKAPTRRETVSRRAAAAEAPPRAGGRG